MLFLFQEISRLEKENEKLKERIRSLESKVENTINFSFSYYES